LLELSNNNNSEIELNLSGLLTDETLQKINANNPLTIIKPAKKPRIN
jgi:hypothetical protein